MPPADLPALLLAIQTGSTCYLAGLCWFVQRVHYPLFGRVGVEAFPDYEREHVARTGPVVAPVMLLELATAAAMAVWRPAGVPAALPWIGLALLAGIWASTFALQVPRHRALSEGFAERTHRGLVASNWIRTAAWSARAVLLLAVPLLPA